jgi:acetyl esterase/lipase
MNTKLPDLPAISAPAGLKERFEEDVLEGLMATPKRLQSKYFYDEQGDLLFQQIMACPEYYLTNCEREIISLYKGKGPGSEQWNWEEKILTDPSTGNRTVINVSDPTLAVYRPDPAHTNRGAVIICPGGAFHVLDIDNEGYRVAKILAEKGFTAFVLKYRLLHLDPKNPFAGMGDKMIDFKKLEAVMDVDVPLAINDGKAAMAFVKDHAKNYKIEPSKVGIIGFSAGGTVAAGIAYATNEKERAAFVATLYPYLAPFKGLEVPSGAAPLFIAVAEDDTFKFDQECLSIYKDWKNKANSAELHIYAKGSHGFGNKIQHLPVDHWMDRFFDWLSFLGYRINSSN